MKPDLTQDRLRQLLDYDPATGVFTWRVFKGSAATAGRVAGSRDRNGYVQIRIDNRDYKAHRLAFLYVRGRWPKLSVDHINGLQGDNRWENLRELSQRRNSENARRARSINKTGFLGVSPSGKRFKAQIQVNGKQFNLGRYMTPEAAHQVYLAAKRDMHQGNTL